MSNVDEIIEEVNEAVDSGHLIAEDLKRFCDAADRLLATGLTKRALILLLKDKSGVPQYQISRLLDALPLLRDFYREVQQ